MARLLRGLSEHGIADDTLLIYFTDNGGPSDFRGNKSSEWEGGHRVPCFIRWKHGGILASGGRDVPELTAHIDLVPTLVDDLAGLDALPVRHALPLHGRSLRRLLLLGVKHDVGRGAGVPWNQRLIAFAAPGPAGFNAVTFARSGPYRFEMQRWPREIAAETTLTSALQHPVQGTLGSELPIASARLRVWQDDFPGSPRCGGWAWIFV